LEFFTAEGAEGRREGNSGFRMKVRRTEFEVRGTKLRLLREFVSSRRALRARRGIWELEFRMR
jgi:hypothetical protein